MEQPLEQKIDTTTPTVGPNDLTARSLELGLEHDRVRHHLAEHVGEADSLRAIRHSSPQSHS